MKTKPLFVWLVMFGFMGVLTAQLLPHEESEPPALLTPEREYGAGENIELAFAADDSQPYQLFLHHSLGSTLVEPRFNGNKMLFSLPTALINKAGLVHWALVAQQKAQRQGTFSIRPANVAKPTIESYIGPRSVQAGPPDYAMFVAFVADSLDNPLPKGTAVTLTKQFQSEITTSSFETRNLVACDTLFSPTQSGRILMTAQSGLGLSKELTCVVYPANPTNFRIAATRPHAFADGTQFTRLYTQVITDAYGNIVSDGTCVVFAVNTQQNMQLYAFGTTIEGVATAQMAHPELPSRWRAKAYINGFAESDTLVLDYASVLQAFDITFSRGNRLITVGPLKSFMQQLIPDGMPVTLTINDANGQWIETCEEGTTSGFAEFALPKDFYPQQAYQFTLSVLGVTQHTQTIVYEDE